MQDSGLWNIDRDLDVVDLLWGKVVAAQGVTSIPVDRFRMRGITDTGDKNITEYMSTMNGFMRALRLVLRLQRGGILAMGPPCSSFVRLNAVNCKRKHSNNFKGDEAYLPVCLGNLLSTAAALFMTVASVRQVQVVVENHLRA
jgi:hypothetical protein